MRAASVLRRRVVLLAVGVLTVALLPALAGQPGATISAAVTGPDVGSQQPGIAWESTAAMNADLDAMVAAGMSWVRADFSWSSIEYQHGRFAWGATDTFVRAASARGLRVLAIADYTPAWARSGPTDKYPPRNPSDYATFVGAAAAHYAPMGVHAWEIWNEPNMAMFWAPRADPAAYTTLLVLAHAAIKRSDPSATVVSGGLSPASDNGHDVAPMTFLSSIYAHGGRAGFDAVGYHPYSYPYAPMYHASWNTFYMTPSLYSLMAAHGDGFKRVWGTEIGFPTGTASKAVSPAMQAQHISAAIEQWTSWSFHGPIFFYTIRDLGTNAGDVNQNMGMFTHSGAPKPVYTTVRRQLQAPRDLHATAVSGGASVTWSPPSWDYGRAITGYRIVADPGGATQTVPGDARSATFALGDGIAEQFSVVPLRGSDAGVPSALSNAVVPGLSNIVPGAAVASKPHSGTVTLHIPVTLDTRSSLTISASYTTVSAPPLINARPGVDYTTTSGTVTFAPGQTTASVAVTVLANADTVENDLFLVAFSHPQNATLGGYFGLGLGVIS